MAVTIQQIKELKKQGYDNWDSWAIWDPENMAVDHFCQPFCDLRLKWYRENIESSLLPCLRNDIVVLGLNVSTECKGWSNFHLTQERAEQIKREQNQTRRNSQYDRRLRYLFDKSLYRGAFMADLLRKVDSNGNNIIARIRDGSIAFESHFDYLYNQLKIIDVNDKTIFILIHSRLPRLFNKFKDYVHNAYHTDYNGLIVRIPHCTPRFGSTPDSVYLENAWAILEKFAKNNSIVPEFTGNREKKEMQKVLEYLKKQKDEKSHKKT